MTKKEAKVGHHGQTAVPDRGMKHGTPIQSTPMAGTETPRGRYGWGKGKIEDAVNQDTPTNRTPSHKAGGSVIRDAHRGTEGREPHIAGGCKD